MKLLLHSMSFAPELVGVGRYSGELAQWLAAQGHEVRVIASPPFFPHWKVFDGHSGAAWRRSEWQGVSVWRAPTWVPARPRTPARLAHLLSFALSSLPLLLAQWRWRPDLVMVVEPPLMCAPAVLLFCRLRGVKSWLHIQDYEVDAAFGLGLVRGGLLRRLALAAERWLLRRFDRVSTISGAMHQLAIDKGVDPARLVLFPNGVDVQAIRPGGPHDPDAPNPAHGFRAALGIPSAAVVVLYAGSLGHKQGIELLAQAAAQLVDSPLLHFVFCGNGPSRDGLVAACDGLRRVHFLELQPAERLNELLGMADIHVLPQRAGAADRVMPSKLTGMLASGRAVIATAEPDTELGCALLGRGLLVPPGDAPALADAILQLAMAPAQREALGCAGRAYAEAELDQATLLRRLERELLRCVAGPADAMAPT